MTYLAVTGGGNVGKCDRLSQDKQVTTALEIFAPNEYAKKIVASKAESLPQTPLCESPSLAKVLSQRLHKL